MKKLLTIIFLLTIRICNGQNLVPNPSFEDTVGSCPTTLSGGTIDWVTHAVGWKSFARSCDYYNACANPTPLGVPDNLMGHHFAVTGVAYCGFVTCSDTNTGQNGREFLGCQLIQNLTIGQKYFVSMKVVRTQEIGGHCWACNKIGARFTTFDLNEPEGSTLLVNNIAQVYTDSIVLDSINWTTIKGSFIADSSYQYIVLGNFFDDAHTLVAPCMNTTVGYYLVDDICVSTDSLTCYSTSGAESISQNRVVNCFPNPFHNNLNFYSPNYEKAEIIFLDILSRKILQQTFTNTTTINTEQLANGIYIYELRNDKGIITRGKLIKQ